MKHKKSIFFPTFIVIFIVGYAFFLTSKLWYPNGDDLVTATKLNTEKFFNGRTVKVMRWDYSKSQGLCEVELDISNQQYDGIDTYDYEAILPSGKELDIHWLKGFDKILYGIILSKIKKRIYGII